MSLKKPSDVSVANLWIEIAESLNSVMGPKKTVEEWKKVTYCLSIQKIIKNLVLKVMHFYFRFCMELG